jgi:hypothetical protein
MPLNILVIGASGHLLVLGICTYDLLTKAKEKIKQGVLSGFARSSHWRFCLPGI